MQRKYISAKQQVETLLIRMFINRLRKYKYTLINQAYIESSEICHNICSEIF